MILRNAHVDNVTHQNHHRNDRVTTMSDPLPPAAAKPTYHAPSSNVTADYRIRCDPNPLREDPDIEEDVVYSITPGSKVTDCQLVICASHFSLYYGVWSRIARHRVRFWAKPGTSPGSDILRKNSLTPAYRPQDTYYSRTVEVAESAGRSAQCPRDSHDETRRTNRPLFRQPVEAR